MENKTTEFLKKSWEGEILGESFFAALVDAMPEDRDTWAVLTRLEATTGRLVEGVAKAHGIEIKPEEVATAGEGFARGAAAGSRDDLLKGILAVTGEFLPMYRELGTLLGPDEVWISAALVAHEQALISCTEAALAGEEGGDQAVLDFLAEHEVAAAG